MKDFDYLYRESPLEIEFSGPDCSKCGDDPVDTCSTCGAGAHQLQISTEARDHLHQLALDIGMDPRGLVETLIYLAEVERTPAGLRFLLKQ